MSTSPHRQIQQLTRRISKLRIGDNRNKKSKSPIQMVRIPGKPLYKGSKKPQWVKSARKQRRTLQREKREERKLAAQKENERREKAMQVRKAIREGMGKKRQVPLRRKSVKSSSFCRKCSTMNCPRYVRGDSKVSSECIVCGCTAYEHGVPKEFRESKKQAVMKRPSLKYVPKALPMAAMAARSRPTKSRPTKSRHPLKHESLSQSIRKSKKQRQSIRQKKLAPFLRPTTYYDWRSNPRYENITRPVIKKSPSKRNVKALKAQSQAWSD